MTQWLDPNAKALVRAEDGAYGLSGKDQHHCWHANGYATTTLATRNNVIRESVICCRCGNRSTRTGRQVDAQLDGHGPHHEIQRIQYEPVLCDTQCHGASGSSDRE